MLDEDEKMVSMVIMAQGETAHNDGRRLNIRRVAGKR